MAWCRFLERQKEANRAFYNQDRRETNLLIIQKYLERIEPEKVRLLALKRWTNCNTREDYGKIREYWAMER